jgi:hypothetical protein
MSKVISNTLAYHYDEELFNNAWTSELDPTSTVLLESGAMVEDATIARLIAGGGNYYTLPFYKDIEGDEQNYDGATDITTDDTEDGVQSGVVYGREKGWESTIFVNDFTAADPMRNILNRIQKWKAKKVQARVISILEAILGVTGTGDFADWENHKMDITSASSTVTDDNKIGLTTLRDLAVQSNGDAADDYALAIMHSVVANRLSQFNVLEFFKYNDANGQERDVKVGRSGNMLVLICDEVPHAADTNGNMVYTTYCLGRGVLLHANAPVEHPSDYQYDPVKRGGMEYLYTRYRETIHPNGFTFAMENLPISPTDAQLGASANWSIVMNPKNIAIASLKTNG